MNKRSICVPYVDPRDARKQRELAALCTSMIQTANTDGWFVESLYYTPTNLVLDLKLRETC